MTRDHLPLSELLLVSVFCGSSVLVVQLPHASIVINNNIFPPLLKVSV